MNLVRLDDAGYKKMLSDWRKQCEDAGEDFEAFTQIPVEIYRQITEKDKKNTGLYSLITDQGHDAIALLNHALIPGYVGPVLRVRHILLSPQFDLGERPINEYASTLVKLLVNVLWLSENDTNISANYVKFHARSPADIPFFSAVGTALDGTGQFASVQQKGAWLYITRN